MRARWPQPVKRIEAFHEERPRPVPRGTPLSEIVPESVHQVLARGLRELGAVSSDRTDELSGRLAELAELLQHWRGQINLTAHRTSGAIARRLILDAVALCQAIPQFESLADLGSGAGFPGLPIALLRPRCKLTLVEARERPHHFQRAAVRRLGIENVTLLLGRADTLKPRPHAAVIAQAMAQPEQALLWMLPWVEPGGLVLLPGGKNPPQLTEIKGVFELPPVVYPVPCGGPKRSVWMGRRSVE